MERAGLANRSQSAPSIFHYFLDHAMAKAGPAGRRADRSGAWAHILPEGLATWAEQDLSQCCPDCHASGASPNVEFPSAGPW